MASWGTGPRSAWLVRSQPGILSPCMQAYLLCAKAPGRLPPARGSLHFYQRFISNACLWMPLEKCLDLGPVRHIEGPRLLKKGSIGGTVAESMTDLCGGKQLTRCRYLLASGTAPCKRVRFLPANGWRPPTVPQARTDGLIVAHHKPGGEDNRHLLGAGCSHDVANGR